VQTEVFTIRVSADTAADIDSFAAERFPVPCPKCKGSGKLRTGAVCPHCKGTGNVGSRADALRYLLQYSIGEQSSPQARAMAAVYENIAPKLVHAINTLAHSSEAFLREQIMSTLAPLVASGGSIGPRRKRKP